MANDVSETKLLPCPFCGEVPLVAGSTIWCANGACWGPHMTQYAGLDDAIAAWNRRPSPPEAVAGLVERLPLVALSPANGRPEWQQIADLFKRHGLPDPPSRLRDELVVHLLWARYGVEAADALSRLSSGGDGDVQRVADAVAQSFRDIVAEVSGDSWEATGVTLPSRSVFERYAKAAITALTPSGDRK